MVADIELVNSSFLIGNKHLKVFLFQLHGMFPLCLGVTNVNIQAGLRLGTPKLAGPFVASFPSKLSGASCGEKRKKNETTT